MEKYLRIFNFLWRLKRVEYALSASWQTMKPNTMALLEKRLGAPGRALAVELRRCQTLRNEMNHFVTNLQYYMMLEVRSAHSRAAAPLENVGTHAMLTTCGSVTCRVMGLSGSAKALHSLYA
jgi:hypothetical protein